MRASLLMIFILIYFVYVGQTYKIKRPGQPDIYKIDTTDKEMNAAISKSRLTFDDFETTFKNHKKTQRHFCVKVPIETTDGKEERIWLVNIELRSGKLIGQVDNLPAKATNLKLGDRIEIERSKISDWFYIDNNKLIGGRTIRVLRDRMHPREKEQFDKQFGVKFD